MIAGQEQIPKPLGAGAAFQLLQHRRPVVAMPVLDLLLIEVFDRRDMAGHEGGQLFLQLDCPGTVFEIHFAISLA